MTLLEYLCKSLRVFIYLFIFINTKKAPKFRAARSSRWLPNLNHDCSVSRPTHTWTCHAFLWKRRRKRQKCRSASSVARALLLSLSLGLTWNSQCSLALGSAVYRPDCATFCVTSLAAANHSRVPQKRVRGKGTPLDQSEACSWERVHTGTWLGYAVHVSRSEEVEHCCCVKCKCRTGTPNPVLTHGNGAPIAFLLTFKRKTIK